MLVTSRLRLVSMTAADTDHLARLLSEPGVRRFLCDGEILPRTAVASLIEESLKLAPSGLGLWGVDLEGSSRIGYAGFAARLRGRRRSLPGVRR